MLLLLLLLCLNKVLRYVTLRYVTLCYICFVKMILTASPVGPKSPDKPRSPTIPWNEKRKNEQWKPVNEAANMITGKHWGHVAAK